jgi:ribonuclease E
MSRQRIRAGVLESSSIQCPHCGGSGYVRATSSVALHTLRSIEEALVKSATHNLILRTRTEACLYILNQKRAHLHELEMRFGVTVTIAADDSLVASSPYLLERGELAVKAAGPVTGVRATAISPVYEAEEDEIEDEVGDETEVEAETNDGTETREAGGESSDENGRRRRRRRRRRGGRTGSDEESNREGDESDESGESSDETESGSDEGGDAEVAAGTEGDDTATDGEGDGAGRRRRRGRRGGRGRERERGGRGRSDRGEDSGSDEAGSGAVAVSAEEPVSAETVMAVSAEVAREPAAQEPAAYQPVANGADVEPAVRTDAPIQDAVDLPVDPVPAAAEPDPQPVPAPQPAPEPVAVVLTPVDPDRPKRAGWWSRTKAALTGE